MIRVALFLLALLLIAPRSGGAQETRGWAAC